MGIQRSLSIDLLRGIAILLVLVRHLPPDRYSGNIGWTGVDLFFVLSGYLVSGLLFKEYERRGTIRPVHFLIRRGFKIYPTFYGLLPLAAWVSTWRYGFAPIGLLSELTFTQNYLFGFGWWPYTVTWSLAIEEHFYIALTLAVYVASRLKLLAHPNVLRLLLGIMVVCLVARYISNALPYYRSPSHALLLFTSSHLRADALCCGVAIAWLERFRGERLMLLVRRYGTLLPWMAAALLAFTPFVPPIGSWMVQTVGFTLVYLGYAMLLMYVLYVRPVPSARLTRAIGRVGQWSYPIYLSHVFIPAWLYKQPAVEVALGGSLALRFGLYMVLSIALGALLSLTWEAWWLKVRDARFPSRHV